MRVEESIEIDRPPEKVFDYVAKPENLPEWSGIVLEVHKETQGELREGERFTTVAKFLGRRFETPMEVTAHEPPRRHSDRSTGGPFPQEYTFVLEETAGGRDALDRGSGGRAGRLLQVSRTAARDGRQAAVQGRLGKPQGSARGGS